VYIQFEGPTQLCADNAQLFGHGISHHPHGFGSPVGFLKNATKCLSDMSDSELTSLGLQIGSNAELVFESGVLVAGMLTNFTRHPQNGQLIMITFENCRVTHQGKTLFDPAWGVFDMAIGSTVVSVFGGPADRLAFGETDDFVAKVIPKKVWSPLMQHKHELYQKVRTFIEGLESGRFAPDQRTSDELDNLLEQIEGDLPHDWLLRLEMLELSDRLPSKNWRGRVEMELKNLSDKDADTRHKIEDGLRVMSNFPAGARSN
jgi:phenylalanine-4-hydroxylase